MRRSVKEIAVPPEDAQDREERHRRVEKARTDKETGAVGEEVERFEEQGAELSLADLGGDLPLVLRGGDQVLHQKDDQEIEDHLAKVVPGDRSRGASVDGAPDKDRAEERD